jgi:WhiB family transcriptional regulator, redox-sensing transcriptional regulator
VDGWLGGEAELMSRTSLRIVGLLVHQEHWRTSAARQFADPDLFFPISSSGPSGAQVAQAKAICAGCPVQRECLAFALRTHQVHGVWGGLTEQERYPLTSPTLAGVERGHAAYLDTVHAADLRDDMSTPEQLRQRTTVPGAA